ncbi:hypothetical protein Q1695_005711 [Nippostrongylus brasiliensis]|nr:hypothetical protein Q1695_005711 [Nippostrongylus brasiliensis]
MFDGGRYSGGSSDENEDENAPMRIPEHHGVSDYDESPEEMVAPAADFNIGFRNGVRQLLRIPIGIRNGVRQFLRILNARVRNGNHRALDAGNDGSANPNFDVQESAKHQYLFKPARASEEVDVGMTLWCQPGRTYTVPIIRLDLIVLPGQMVPMQIHNSVSRSIVQRAIDEKSYLGLLPIVQGDLGPSKERHGILLQVSKYLNDGLTMKVQAMGRQRFRVISMENETASTSMARVEVLPNNTRTPLIEAVCPTRVRQLPSKKKLHILSEMCNIPSFVADKTNLDHQCQELGSWMKMWFSSDKIQAALEQGPVSFSYWAARNIPMTLTAKYEHLVENETNLRVTSLLNLIDQMTDLVCRGCGLLICSVRDIVNMNSEGTSSHFVNSAGYIHEMVTVAEAQNFVPRDVPCAKFSWFPGYKWQIIECRFCMDHLGWEFTSRRYNPAKFYGITRKAVVPRMANKEEQD